jgi:hypothetical protein
MTLSTNQQQDGRSAFTSRAAAKADAWLLFLLLLAIIWMGLLGFIYAEGMAQ